MTAHLATDDPVLEQFAERVGATGPIAVEGHRTRWDVGGPLVDGTPTVMAPAGIVEYVAEEMTVTVRAGTPVAELEAALAEQGQWTALPERGGTVGGAIAVGQNDHLRPLRGDLRATVLQVRYISAEGRIVSGGGPTVKNVSGFDIPRLITGSLGTLGCIAEVILRTNPIPAARRWFEADDADAFAVHAGLLAPGAVLWDGERTHVLLAGHEPDVSADAAILDGLGTFRGCEPPEPPSGHRWSLRPADLSNLEALDVGTFVAEVGVGVVHAEKPPPDRPLDPKVALIHDRMKVEFDPSNRLNPGRVVGAR
ncbi:MAG: FAD-binding protein [Acidimicrobiales bacterium]